ncbi:hypothetical protein LINGRAPRIM_LOCUS2815 [Linum grandiflorum]
MDRLKTHQRLLCRPQVPHRRPHNPQARHLHPPRPALRLPFFRRPELPKSVDWISIRLIG